MSDNQTIGAITAVGGFRATGIACGIKKEQQPDLALIDAGRCVPAAAVFTTSNTAAPPVKVCRAHLAESARARAVIITSGIANAGTGEPGVKAARETATHVANQLGCSPTDILVCSTGVIGPQLPVERITAALPEAVKTLACDRSAGHNAAKAIMTTDTRPKEALHRGADFAVGGIAKGAGMIRPNMATMIGVVVTDAVVSEELLQQALRAAVDKSFNAINIDGCQSTNDTVFALASGAAGVEPTAESFTATLTAACRDLARQIVADAECATRVITLRITGAEDDDAARNIGKFVADSDLVRSSFYGGDPNWGRIYQALGVCGYPMAEDAIDISYAGVSVCTGGTQTTFDFADLCSKLASGDFVIDICVGKGGGGAEVLTCDLTPAYVTFNGEHS